MSGMRVGVMDTALVARPAVDSLTRANYLAAVANRVDSFWVPDHLNALFPRSIWAPKYCAQRGSSQGRTHHWSRGPCSGTWPPATGWAACALG